MFSKTQTDFSSFTCYCGNSFPGCSEAGTLETGKTNTEISTKSLLKTNGTQKSHLPILECNGWWACKERVNHFEHFSTAPVKAGNTDQFSQVATRSMKNKQLLTLLLFSHRLCHSHEMSEKTSLISIHHCRLCQGKKLFSTRLSVAHLKLVVAS